jgi:DNA-binding HxlR family transcriptional regulator
MISMKTTIDMSLEEFEKEIKEGKIQVHDNPFKSSLDLLTGKWTALVLFTILSNGTVRFGEIKRSLPEITSTMLASTLKELTDGKFIIRKQYEEVPLRVEYTCTEKAIGLIPVLYDLAQWYIKYCSDDTPLADQRIQINPEYTQVRKH